VSLLKGLKIGRITTQLVETHEFSPNPDAPSEYLDNHKAQKVVANDEYSVTDEPDILDEEVEGYKFSRHIELPKSLTKCMQDAETRGIKIRHKLKFNIQLHNPDDHTSELRASLPVALFISPSLPINDNNELVDQTPVAARHAIQASIEMQAPPLYGDHQLDQMYSEVDVSGYRTPANFSTPGTPFGDHSRNISSENLSSLDAITNGIAANGANGAIPGDVSATALRSRLQNLRSGPNPLAHEEHNRSRDNSPEASRRSSAATGNQQRDYFSSCRSSRGSRSRNSPHSSTPSAGNSSRRSSGENGHHQHIDYLPSGTHTPAALEIENLCRVPSYSTAVRAPARTTHSGPGLPTYGAATSGDASLSSSPPDAPAAMPPPPAAHLRGQVASPSNSSSWRGGSTFSARELHSLGGGGLSGNVHRTAGEIQDEERRLRLMQARGRA
jgi:arrestin-related trafficking adapter 4/5/7